MRRPPRQARIRTTHRVQQAAAAKAREARHGGGTSFPPVDMLVYDDSDGEDEDDEGHDDLAAEWADESRSSTSDDTDADDRGNLREQRIGTVIKVCLELSMAPPRKRVFPLCLCLLSHLPVSS